MERVQLHEEMTKLRRELSLMAARVEADLGKALIILRSESESSLLSEVRESGKIVDALQLKIEDMTFVLIATQSPVAGDLRELLVIYKITSALERIGDYGIHLARAAEKFARKASFRSMERIERMAETALQMLGGCFSAFTSRDVNGARKAASLDDKIDDEHKALTEEVLKLMKKKPKLVKSAARLLRISAYMERMGDHITNICEGIIFMIEGRHEELND